MRLTQSVILVLIAYFSLGAVSWNKDLESSLKSRYVQDTGAHEERGVSTIQALHYREFKDTRGTGTIFEVGLVGKNAARGSLRSLSRPMLYLVQDEGGRVEIEPFVRRIPSEGYVVFSRVGAGHTVGGSVFRPSDIDDVVMARFDSATEMEEIFRAVERKSPLAERLYLAGNVEERNNGTNAPWWQWSMKSDRTFISPRPMAIRGEVWEARAILDNKGWLIAGQFSPFELRLDEAQKALLHRNHWTVDNEPQRTLANLFYSDLETRNRHNDLRREVLSYGAAWAVGDPDGFEVNSHSLHGLTVRNVDSETLESIRVESYRHRLILEMDNGQSFTVVFQNDLRNLVGRPIAIRGAMTEEGASWYPAELSVTSQGFTRPVHSGTILIHRLSLDPVRGHIQDFEVEIAYRYTVPGAKEESRGFFRFQARLPEQIPRPVVQEGCPSLIATVASRLVLYP